MASLASLVSLGNASPSSSGHFEGSFSLVQRVSLSKNVPSFRRILVGERWSPKPILKSESNIESPLNINSRSSGHWDHSELTRDSGDGKLKEDEEERNKMIESLGEVLEKAEKLETSKRVGVSVNKTPTNKTTEQRNGKPINSAPGWNFKTAKSVWRRKGNPVASVQHVVKESPNFEKLQKQEPLEVADQVESELVAPLKPPQSPAVVQPKLYAKPSVAPPPLVRKPAILKDVGAAPKTLTIDGTDSAAKTKERKTILIDKFASKKPVVDPLIAAAVLAPPKPGKGPVPGKFRDGFRKKSGPSSGSRRRRVDHDDPDDEALELDGSIPGAVKTEKGRKWSKASRKAARLQAARDATPVKVEILEVEEDGMLTEELAYNLATSQGKILGYLYSKGIKPDGVQTLDKEMVKMICKEYGVEAIDAAPTRVEEMARKKEMLDEDDLDSLQDRPPVLTIMGHVDHGKVAASEAGGITQGIGAYRVLVPIDGKLQPCVFLDTPGHEAFGAMRARGARVTDIAIIVVAADDGIRPQTNEAIAHAKAAGVPIVIAINKIDKDGANPERVMQELASIGLMAENWGGDVPMVQISALKGENVDELLETAMLVAELQDLKANPHRSAKGTVIEAALHKSRGPIATFIVQNGTLKIGDVVVCGEAFGKVRALFDDKGSRVDEAGPSIPVQIIGLNNVPIAGDEFEVVTSLDAAREKAEARAESLRDERISAKAGDGKISLSSLASAVSAGKQSGLDLHQLNIIMKVDVQGSIEAVRQALQVLPQNNVTLKFLLQAPGDVSTSDIDLAVATKAIILGFNVKVPGSVKSYADNKGVEIRLYKVIYDLIDDVRNAMEGLLEPVEEQVKIGAAEVRAIFTSGSGRVAGCMVTEGKFVKDSGIRVLRKGKTVHVGNLSSLRRVKEMVKEVNAGLECGIGMDDFDDWEVGHTLEAFITVQKKRTLEEASATMEAAFAGVRM
ncbi:translation initiation factor 2, small GTP-binding protein [Actinidia rufa]|uniref:Translation initiation factor IF-2, chloroplastic n=1 Tax=Actinidia rufa TaxID=165716 RepID=A0A7J0FGU0_9ERIC|nr:translation initiation factor 2, small GTP-binding protein [Actinidia rufa]